jgi:hypothetical protein
MDSLLANSNELKLTALAKTNFSSNIYPGGSQDSARLCS